MLIAIISDIHNNLPNLKDCLSWCRENLIDKIICCGDIDNKNTLYNLSSWFAGEIFVVRGNSDNYEESSLIKFNNLKYFDESGLIKLDNLQIGFCHEPRKIPKILKKPEHLDFVFYGHTHKPWIEKKDDTIIANPGNIGGIIYPATFSTLDTKTKILNLKRLSD